MLVFLVWRHEWSLMNEIYSDILQASVYLLVREGTKTVDLFFAAHVIMTYRPLTLVPCVLLA